MEQTQMKEALDSLRVLPRDIDRLCPSIWEPTYVDADGSGHFKTMLLASITPHYLTFRIGSPRTSIGWLEFKVSRRRTGLGFTFVFWRGKSGELYCRLQEVEAGLRTVGRRSNGDGALLPVLRGRPGTGLS